MTIHENFPGGNIELAGTWNDTVWLRPALRDTAGRWFYWAFCIEGAEGRTLTFDFNDNLLGYFGPAISRDLKTWEWCGAQSLLPGNKGFSFTFQKEDTCVYFAHHLLYPTERITAFSNETGVPMQTLAPSRNGNDIPLLQFGDGEKRILLTARHHCCESTGSYVLEGAARYLRLHLPAGYCVTLVPFVDYDGVLRGDQGKNRIPHDHNRDYTDAPLYPEIKALQTLTRAQPLAFALDFHSPWHLGGRNDHVFFPRNLCNPSGQAALSALFTEECTGLTFGYNGEEDIAPFTEWNNPQPIMFSGHFGQYPEIELSLTLETAYFGTSQTPNSQTALLQLGEAFAKALCRYIQTI